MFGFWLVVFRSVSFLSILQKILQNFSSRFPKMASAMSAATRSRLLNLLRPLTLVPGGTSTFPTFACIHTSICNMRRKDLRSKTADLPPPDEGTVGEHSLTVGANFGPLFPTLETHNTMFDGMLFTDVPIVYIKCSQNNTIISLVKPPDYGTLLLNSCGIEGFRNCKKGTNVAGQAVGLGIGKKIIALGHPTVRVQVKGLGPGRASSIKGLEMAGIKIISITDNTPIPDNGNRPRKARRI